ncbi:hypothetical protein A0128_08325 [Leptospira tipperaryensis]|uniref:Uncharacterized protein n=1 Tax=Leptospira tipperaryensis TaxID=2564040 RepID=A0A1D7UWA3_9LEPT|nr:hypothetical protein A0128_08325 [Leptospira tipperaryensis]
MEYLYFGFFSNVRIKKIIYNVCFFKKKVGTPPLLLQEQQNNPFRIRIQGQKPIPPKKSRPLSETGFTQLNF